MSFSDSGASLKIREMSAYSSWYSKKTVLITGATSGLGLEMARLMGGFGARILPCGRNSKAIDSLLDELRTTTESGHEGFISDLSDYESLRGLIESVSRKHEVDILINCAGFGYINDFSQMPRETIRSMQEVNVTAVVELCRAFIPAMEKRRKGGVLNIGSVASFFATPGSALYGATKHFVLGFTDALHEEMLSKGVHVTGVYPGHMYSEFLSRSTSGKGKDWERAMEPKTVAKTALKGLSENKRRIIPGLEGKLKVLAATVLPASFILNRVYGKSLPYRRD